MKGFLRLFPLNWVVFPEERVNLHIFEPRYRQLINECKESGESFGIPFYKEGVGSHGTIAEIESIKKRYSDGRMDITVKGLEPFELYTFLPVVEGRLYPGGKVKSIPVTYSYEDADATLLEVLIGQFFELIGSRPVVVADHSRLSFAYGHKIGLGPDHELELLLLGDESSRQAFLIDHLERLLPTLRHVETTKNRIKMNGHFKNFDTLEF